MNITWEIRMKTDYTHVKHEFEPVFNEKSQILILGSMPSVKSREQQFYYGHPQNRFWKVLSKVFDEKLPETIEEKRRMVLKHHIALWDVIGSCDIIGSSDSSIKNVIGNDMNIILDNADIRTIYLNGTKAYELFEKYCKPMIKKNVPTLVKLPSTSPANAAWNIEKLIACWQQICYTNQE